ncbi:MAG TPA: helix-turn-helix domain-containing protein [Candidatus Omnitrophota bacterium]|nr:helix-turn-helix domain-containing protein [Candidatus Omnitrophota bacterium]HPS19626.1 helix-turn-helix domain-containing protein [Candidatus Omnitrophota bacterium]
MKKEACIDRIDRLFLTIGNGGVYDEIISETEQVLIEKALKRSFGNQSIAAKLLGINRNTLRMKIKKLNIDVRKHRI